MHAGLTRWVKLDTFTMSAQRRLVLQLRTYHCTSLTDAKGHNRTHALHHCRGRQRLGPSRGIWPIAVMFNGDRLEVSAVLTDGESVERLIMALEANKPLLPGKAEKKDEAAN
jgi:hypothetical protein